MEEASRGNLVSVGERIKQARTEAGLTQDELAELIGVGMRQVQYYEAGDSNPYRKLSRIAEVTNRTVGWILHGDSPASEPAADALAERLAALEAGQERSEELLHELLRRLPEDPAEGEAHAG